MKLFCLTVVVLFSSNLICQNDEIKNPKITDIAWMSGEWTGMLKDSTVAEEIISEPEAGLIMGMFRLTKNNKTNVLEFYTIKEVDGQIQFHFRHFDVELNSWEKDRAIFMKLTKITPTEIVFENQVNNSPKKTTITKINDNEMRSIAEIITKSGETKYIDVTMRRKNK